MNFSVFTLVGVEKHSLGIEPSTFLWFHHSCILQILGVLTELKIKPNKRPIFIAQLNVANLVSNVNVIIVANEANVNNVVNIKNVASVTKAWLMVLCYSNSVAMLLMCTDM